MPANNVFFCERLSDAFVNAGLPYPTPEPRPGQLSRFSTNDDPSDLAGWCKVFPDGVGAVFGCHREGLTSTWQKREGNTQVPTEMERIAARFKAEAIKDEVETKRATGYANAAQTAKQIWDRAIDAGPAHGYITRKCIKPMGARLAPDGRLVVPVYDTHGNIQSLQHIGPNGEKRFLSGGKMQGGRLFLGTPADGLPLVLAEGWATGVSLWESTGMVVAVSFSGSNMKLVAADLRRQFQKSLLIIAGDLDAHGKGAEYARAAANAASGSVVVLPRFADVRDRGDFNDLHLSYGMEAVKGQIDSAMSPPTRYRLLTDADLASLPPLQWRIHNVLPSSGLAALFGPSGSGKSFLVLDMLQSLAAGADWFNCRVKACPVIYVALEGEAGLVGRVNAYRFRHGKTSEGIRYLVQPFSLLDGGDIHELAQAIRLAGGAGVVVLDTLNRATPGTDENDSKSMGAIIAAAKNLQTLIGGLVLLVHHTGKDATKGLRGHSSLYAALDCAIEVRREGARRSWLLAKSKDGADDLVHTFTLEIVGLGTDEDGNPVTSCVIRPLEGAEQSARIKMPPKAGNQKIIWDALGELFRKAGTARPNDAPTELPPGRPCIRMSDAIEQTRARLVVNEKRLTERAQAAITGLINRGLLESKDGYLWCA